MTANASSARETIEDALRELAATRDEARLQAHLFSLEAKTRLGHIESNFRAFEQRLRDGGGAVEAAIVKANELTSAIRHILTEGADNATLSTPVRVVMSRGVRTCSAEDTLSRAAQVMWESDCGVVPVVDAENKLQGMITDRDVCMAAYIQGAPLSAALVGSAMSRDIAIVAPDEPLRVVTEIMRRRQVRRVPVVDAEGKLMGVVSLADLLHVVEPSQVWLTETLAGICDSGPRESSVQKRQTAS